jgi:hypothetical protein
VSRRRGVLLKRVAGYLLLCVVVLCTGCAAGTALSAGDSSPTLTGSGLAAPLPHPRAESSPDKWIAGVNPAGLVGRAALGSAVRVDAFESLLLRVGLERSLDSSRPLTSQETTRLLTALLRVPVSLATFPQRRVVSHLLREVLEDGELPREELLRRVERFRTVAVLRPDGCLAWALSGHTQQRVGPVEWKQQAFRAGPFELGVFYTGEGGVFRQADARLRPVSGPPLAEVHDDADYISRSLDGAEESLAELSLALGQLLVHPVDSLASLRNLPSGVAALLASSPEYLERLRYMTRGEQVKALSKLTTSLLSTLGTAGATTRTLRGVAEGLHARVPVLTLSAEGALVMERMVVPVGQAVTVLSRGPGAAIFLHRANSGGSTPSPSAGPGQWGPANESMSDRARAYQEQISGHSASEAYWVGGMDPRKGGVKFDGFEDGVLLEAKGPGYANKFLDDLTPKAWFKSSGARELIEQAERQRRAVQGKGIPIRWHIAEEKTAEAIRRLFEEAEIVGVEVVYIPPL